MAKGEVNPGLAAYQERKRKEKEEKEAQAGAAQAVEEAPPELSEDLGSVFRLLEQARHEKSSFQAMNQIRSALSKLSEEDYEALRRTDEFQRLIQQAASTGEDRLPAGSPIVDKDGRIIGKVPWTAGDIKERFPPATWTPIITGPILVFGHSIYIEAGVEVTAPGIFKTIYDQTIEATRTEHDRNMEAVALHGGGTPTHSVGWFKEEE